MSRLNAGAFEFVPGRGFSIPTKQPSQPQPPPLERPEQTDAPPPPPTISLNIGGSRPTPPSENVPPPKPAAIAQPAAPASTPALVPNKVFSTEKAKTDTSAIAKEVQSVADAAVLEDLYGDSKFFLVSNPSSFF